MNTITINLCDQDRELLSNILEALKSQQNCTQCAQISSAYAQELKVLHSEPKAEDHPVTEPFSVEPTTTEVEPKEAPEPVEEPEPVAEVVMTEEEPITHAELLSLVRELSKTKHFSTARDIVKSYADCVSDIPEDKLAEAYFKLNALE